MKNLYVTLSLFVFLIIFASFVFLPKSRAQNNLINDLLRLPAPPPPNPNFFVRIDANSRSTEFYSQENPPADDAPIEDLLAYWGKQNLNNSVYDRIIKPSNRVLDRIFAEVEKNPETAVNFLNVLAEKPSFPNFVKRLYEQNLKDENSDSYQAERVKNWLKYNTDYFSGELLESAAQVTDTDEYITNQEELLALAKTDWEKALPLLNKMVNDSSQPISQTLANWAFYLHYLKENSSEADRYRDALMKTVENKNAKPGDRDLAFDALVYGGDFAGRDDWYFSLLEDETLFDLRVNGRSFTGLTTLLLRSPPGKYKDKMLELVKSSNLNVRSMAARNLATLLDENDAEVVRALLPWLENPDWAKQVRDERTKLISALSEVEIPESVPGLIGLLDEKESLEESENYDEDSEYSEDTDYSSNIINANVSLGQTKYKDYYPYRTEAINALAKQKSLQAVPALRRILPEVGRYEREIVIKAILESGGFSVAEQIDALELIAEFYGDNLKMSNDYPSVEYGNMNVRSRPREMPPPPPPPPPPVPRVNYGANVGMPNTQAMTDKKFDPDDIKPLLGKAVAEISEPPRELVSAVASRIEQLDNGNSTAASFLRKILEGWRGAAVNALMLSNLANGKADADTVLKLLSLRRELREKQSNDVFAARNGDNPAALGITACILENEGEYAPILASDNVELKTALLGCARLIRAKLPIQTVAENLKNQNKTLAKAAELYLESEDSLQARTIIYALYPNKAKILGATAFFAPENAKFPSNYELVSSLFASVDERLAFPPYLLYSSVVEASWLNGDREKLQKEIIETPEIVGIYAYNENFVRIYADRAVFSWSENEARYRERKLDEREFDLLKNYLASNNVSELPPFIGNCNGGCPSRELLMLGANGGRRVYVKSETMPEFFAGLDKIFDDFRKPPAKLKYYLEKEIGGLEILYADDKFPAQAVWKNAADLRLFIQDAELTDQSQEELQRLYENIYKNGGETRKYADIEKELQTKRVNLMYKVLSWRSLKNGKLGDYVGQPPEFDILPHRDNLPVISGRDQWKRRAGNIEFRTDGNELYWIKNGQIIKTQPGIYGDLLLSTDGRWLVGEKINQENESDYRRLIVINVLTGKETIVKLSDQITVFRPLAFVPSTRKFLIVGGSYNGESQIIKFFLLDGETAALQEVKGEFMPLIQQSFRPLQTNGKPDEFWAAIPDEKKWETLVGVYNARNFTFKPKLKIPRITFDSMNLWVDEPENKVYFVYQGQLLALPLR